MKIIVLGAGLVGAPMALDLARDKTFEVHVVDYNSRALERLSALEPSITTEQRDLSNPDSVEKLVGGYDLVLSAVPGFMGYQTLTSIIRAGRNVVDIAFFPEDPLQLDALAREHGVVAIVDCGVAPGMSNILIGSEYHKLDKTYSAIIYVGGLPLKRQWPWDYKAPFSPIDVIEEYTRPARYVEHGVLVTRPALSDSEFMDFEEVGTLEAFNSDGLRSLMKTLPIPSMKEKTMRYPGHIEKIKVLREAGFFDKEPIVVHGTTIKPLDVTAALLFPKWKLEEREVDVTVMKVIIEGEKDGQPIRITWDLFDRYDAAMDIHSMARTTGYTATMAIRMLAEKRYDMPGISPPEFIGKDHACVEFILRGLADRNVIYKRHIENTAFIGNR